MGNHQNSLSLHQYLESFLYLHLVLGVGKRAGFIQYHDRRVFQDCTRQRDALHLAAGKINALCTDHSIKSARNLFKNVAALRQMRRVQDFLLRSIRFGGTDVVADAFFEQVDFLKNEGNLFHQLSGRDASHILSTHQYGTFLHVKEARNQPCDGGLAAARRANQCVSSALWQMKANVHKRRSGSTVIGKGDIVKGNTAVCRAFSVGWCRLGKRRFLQDRL